MVGSGLASGLRQLPTSTQLDRAPLLLVKLSSEAGRPQPTSNQLHQDPGEVGFASDHRATALRFCWSIRSRKRSGFHAENVSRRHFPLPTSEQPRSASAGRSEARKRSGFHAVKASRRHFPLPTTRAAALRFCWLLGGWNRSGFRRLPCASVRRADNFRPLGCRAPLLLVARRSESCLTQTTSDHLVAVSESDRIPTARLPRSASAGCSVVGSGPASTL